MLTLSSSKASALTTPMEVKHVLPLLWYRKPPQRCQKPSKIRWMIRLVQCTFISVWSLLINTYTLTSVQSFPILFTSTLKTIKLTRHHQQQEGLLLSRRHVDNSITNAPPSMPVHSPRVETNDRNTDLEEHHHHQQQQETRILSDTEQRILLQKVAEMRRIRTIEREHVAALSSTKHVLPRLRLEMIAHLAGYTNDDDQQNGGELSLAKRVQQVLDDGYVAREMLVTCNMGLVYKAASDIYHQQRKRLQSLSKEDLIQEGVIGLARAVDKWNVVIADQTGCKFSTYAVYWIRAAVLRGIAEKDDMVRIPEHILQAIRKLHAAAKQLGWSGNDDVTTVLQGESLLSMLYASSSQEQRWKEATAAKALVEAVGLTDKQLREAIRVRNQRKQGWASLDQSRLLESDRLIASDISNSQVQTKMDISHVKSTLSRYLRPREVEAISWRYGLNDCEIPENGFVASKSLLTKSTVRSALPTRGKQGEAMSFMEVGKRMQVSAEYGRRLCHAALTKLQKAADSGLLEPAFLF